MHLSLIRFIEGQSPLITSEVLHLRHSVGLYLSSFFFSVFEPLRYFSVPPFICTPYQFFVVTQVKLP